jgi:uridylate kinase
MGNTAVISLGGSVIVPDKIDVNFLSGFKSIIESCVNEGFRFVIYCGGGNTSRNYQKAASQIVDLGNKDLDWLGIEATRLNAHLLKTIFGKIAEENIVNDPSKKIKFTKKVLIGAGWKPGWSTDYDAVLVAKKLKLKSVINMSNIDYVFEKDPRVFPDAKVIKEISWKEYRKMSGNKWEAGLSMPFDPVAAKEAQKSKLKVIIVGNNLSNFMSVLKNQEFEGTVIQ